MNTIIEHETLGKIVDGLIAKKYPNQPPDNLPSLRESAIEKLDDQIGTAIFNKLDDQQIDEIDAMFDREEDDPSAFQAFFDKAGVDLNQVIAETLKQFEEYFLVRSEDE